MKNKIKLTDLSNIGQLYDDMAHLKGGDNPPEEGPLCWGCKCSCDCTNTNTDTTTTNNYNSARNNGISSSFVPIYVMPLVIVLS